MKPYGKLVRRITFLRPNPRGALVPTLDEKFEPKRKVSKGLRRLEKRKRRVLEAKAEYANQMLERHEKSNRERKDGFMRDANWNQRKARQKAWKRLTRV